MSMMRRAERLKITASSHGIGAYWLLPRLGAFLAQYPDVDLHLVMDDKELDLAQREADLAIRMRSPVQADLIQRKLFTVHYHMYAAKTYLKAHPAPKALEEIPDHTIIVYGETAVPEIRDINWLLEAYKKYARPGTRGHIIRINNITGILQAVEAGLGIGVVPDYVAAQHPALERVLPDVAAPGFDVHLVLCRCPATVQAGRRLPRLCGEVLKGLAVLVRAGDRGIGRRNRHGAAVEMLAVDDRAGAGSQNPDRRQNDGAGAQHHGLVPGAHAGGTHAGGTPGG